MRPQEIKDKVSGKGYAVFRLGREYEKLMFVLGFENFASGAGGNGSYTEPSIFTVTAD